MTKFDYFAIAALVLAIGINSLTVYLHKKYRVYDRFGHNALTVHSTLISIFWGGFIATEFLASKSTWRTALAYPVLGWLIMAVALTIFILALRQIGYRALANGNFFGQPLRALGGIYKMVPEPIYVSYSLWYAGIGLVTSLKVFFVLAIVSLIGLVGLEAWVERPSKG